MVSYLKRTSKLGITYGKDEEMKLYSDSSWGRAPRPSCGHAIIYGGAALSWMSKTLKIVPLSSAEAETAVLSPGAKDLMFTFQLMAELRPGKLTRPIKAFVDNTAAIDIVKAKGATGRSKHFERWVHYVRDLVSRQIIVLEHVPTEQMPADIFTKALPYDPFTYFRSILLGK